MTNEDFVHAVKVAVGEATVKSISEELKKPIGRRPTLAAANQSVWFNSLSDDQKQMILDILAKAVDRTMFGFFAVLDNVRAIEERGPKGDLELIFSKDGQEFLLNDPNKEKLHDIYNSKL
jgi:hypothetical protein